MTRGCMRYPASADLVPAADPARGISVGSPSDLAAWRSVAHCSHDHPHLDDDSRCDCNSGIVRYSLAWIAAQGRPNPGIGVPLITTGNITAALTGPIWPVSLPRHIDYFHDNEKMTMEMEQSYSGATLDSGATLARRLAADAVASGVSALLVSPAIAIMDR